MIYIVVKLLVLNIGVKLTDVFACRHSSTSNEVEVTVAVTEVGATNSSYQDQELVCIEQQSDDQKSEIEQEHIM